MRKVLLSVCGLVFNVAVLAALYVPGASYAHAVFWLPFIPAFLTFGSALFVLNGRRVGRVGWDRLWDTLVVLPRWAQAGLGLLFVATVASTLTSQVGTQTDVGFERTFALGAVWISAVGTALHYGVQQGRAPGAGRRSYRIALAIFVVVGAGLAVATFLLGGHPISTPRRRTTNWPRSSAMPRGIRTWSPRTPTTRRSSCTSTPATPRSKPRPAPP